MDKKGSIFILCLWVMILLACLANSIVFRTRLMTKIRSFETKRFEMDANFLSGINMARFLIQDDGEPSVDYQEDDWYGEPKKFKNTNLSKQITLEIKDEESKINLNKANESLLLSLFDILKKNGVELKTDAKKIIDDVSKWREKNNHEPFENIDELFLTGLPHEDIKTLKQYLTVYSSNLDATFKVNINTASSEVLKAIIFSLAGDDFDKENLSGTILKFRDKRNVFRTENLVTGALIDTLKLANSLSMSLLIGQFLEYTTVNSEFFSVRINSKLSNTRSVFVDSILGPRFPSNRLNSEQGQIVSYPLEILTWTESGPSR